MCQPKLVDQWTNHAAGGCDNCGVLLVNDRYIARTGSRNSRQLRRHSVVFPDRTRTSQNVDAFATRAEDYVVASWKQLSGSGWRRGCDRERLDRILRVIGPGGLFKPARADDNVDGLVSGRIVDAKPRVTGCGDYVLPVARDAVGFRGIFRREEYNVFARRALIHDVEISIEG
jgi:hypothetical protein